MADQFQQRAREFLLQKYQNARLFFSREELETDIQDRIPELWIPILGFPTDEAEFAAIQSLWSPVIERLPKTMDQLARVTRGVVLLVDEHNTPSLLYAYANKKGQPRFHQGCLPLTEKSIPLDLAILWSRLPDEFRRLYAIHDGWNVLNRRDMGHLFVQDVNLLSWEEWDLEPEVIATTPVSVERTMIVFESGGSGYMGFEIAEKEGDEARSLVWWSNKPKNPDLKIHFWPVFDTWISIHFEEMAYSFDPLDTTEG